MERISAFLQQAELQAFDTSSIEPKYLVNYQGRNFEVGAAVRELIQTLKISRNIGEAADKFSQLRHKSYSSQDLSLLIDQYIVPMTGEDSLAPARPFLIRKDLVSEAGIARFSKIFRHLFKSWLAFPLLAVCLCLEGVFFFNANTAFQLGQLDLYAIVGILGILIASSAFHELGHASACQHFGVDHGGVGFGLYIMFPVFYTDVSKIWTLSRKQRTVVNLAGVYFQLILLIPFILFYLFTYNHIVKFIILTINFNFLLTLNPFFRFDGYWITSDLTGVPNLRERTREYVGYLINKWKKRPVKEMPFFLTIKKGIRSALIVYTVVVNLFFVFFFGYILPWFLYRFFTLVPGEIKNMVLLISRGQSPSFQTIQFILGQLIFFTFILYFLYRLLTPVFRKIGALIKYKLTKPSSL